MKIHKLAFLFLNGNGCLSEISRVDLNIFFKTFYEKIILPNVHVQKTP